MPEKPQLALDGGAPVRDGFLPYGKQLIDDDDINAVHEVLKSDWLTTGPNVEGFEADFAHTVGAEYAVAVSNGTAALHCAMFAAGIGPGDEVITTPLTFVATANSIRYLGGTVVFADVCPKTLNIDPQQVESLITSKTKAILAVDFAGHPANLIELRKLADKYKLVLIEDAAHSLGASVNERPVGSISDLTTFSLHPVKHITTGEGGVVTTNSDEWTQKLKLFRGHGIETDFKTREQQGTWFYDMVSLGFNYRLTDIQCALGRSQLKKLEGWRNKRADIVQTYNQAFSMLEEVTIPHTESGILPSWHLYVLRLNLEKLRVDRQEIFSALRKENIGVNVHYIPVHWHSYYQSLGYEKGNWPIAEENYMRMLSLPLWPGMSEQDIEDTVTAVKKVMHAYSE